MRRQEELENESSTGLASPALLGTNAMQSKKTDGKGPEALYLHLRRLLTVLEVLIDSLNVARKAGTPPGVVGAHAPVLEHVKM